MCITEAYVQACNAYIRVHAACCKHSCTLVSSWLRVFSEMIHVSNITIHVSDVAKMAWWPISGYTMPLNSALQPYSYLNDKPDILAISKHYRKPTRSHYHHAGRWSQWRHGHVCRDVGSCTEAPTGAWRRRPLPHHVEERLWVYGEVERAGKVVQESVRKV
jgi:hypothetical protein